MVSGTPNLKIHPENNAAATDVAAVLVRGMASIHLLILSMMVRMWLWPKEIVSGPTRSMWMWANLRWGTGIVRGLTWTCRWILDCWHFAQSLVQALTSLLIPDQTNLEHNSHFGASVLGWAMLWMWLKMARQCPSGTSSLHTPVDVSPASLCLPTI